MKAPGSPIRIRAHTLLCLQGYRGLGYDPEFIARMDEVSSFLSANPKAEIRVVTSVDVFCECCPHNVDGRCTVDESEDPSVENAGADNSTEMDRRVLRHLGLEENSVKDWTSILDIVAQKVDSTDMDELCGDCRWRSYGYCAAALDDLARRYRNG